MNDIVIIGAGGMARDVRFLIEELNTVKKQFNFLGYIIKDLKSISSNDYIDKVIGDYNWFKGKKNISVVIGIGNPVKRMTCVNEIEKISTNIVFPSLIHPSVIYDKSSIMIGKGVLICAQVILTVNVKLNNFCLINYNSSIGHESIIGKGTVVNPSSTISGGVKIDDQVLIGAGSTILQYLKIGKKSVVGAGAVVVKSISENVTVMGIPAKEYK